MLDMGYLPQPPGRTSYFLRWVDYKLHHNSNAVMLELKFVIVIQIIRMLIRIAVVHGGLRPRSGGSSPSLAIEFLNFV